MSTTIPEPIAITADVDAREVRVEWSDGHASTYDFDRLRWACP
ncbi:MAG: gamma-butyrobetaine hydroxylase-like domain-containing protein, partial [Thermomicrobiales bacterium]